MNLSLVLPVFLVLHAAAPLRAQTAASATRLLDTVVSLDAWGRLHASNSLGDLVVRGWDRADVRIRINIARPDRMTIGRPLGVLKVTRQAGAQSAPSTLELWVPRRAVVHLRNRDGAIVLQDTEGATSIDGSRADVTANGVKGPLTANTTAGNISVTRATGSSVLTSSSGSITVSDATGDVRVESNAGNLVFDRVRASRITANTNRGMIRLTGPLADGAQHELTSHAGTVHAVVDSNANVTVQLHALRGSVDTPSRLNRTKRDDGEDIVMGKGTATLRMNTFSGLLRLTVGNDRKSNHQDNEP